MGILWGVRRRDLTDGELRVLAMDDDDMDQQVKTVAVAAAQEWEPGGLPLEEWISLRVNNERRRLKRLAIRRNRPQKPLPEDLQAPRQAVLLEEDVLYCVPAYLHHAAACLLRGAKNKADPQLEGKAKKALADAIIWMVRENT